jgi:uncharacterized small protein (DUF1192 family)
MDRVIDVDPTANAEIINVLTSELAQLRERVAYLKDKIKRLEEELLHSSYSICDEEE